MSRLVLICGMPGAGKTTLARRMVQERLLVRLCPDEWLAGLGVDLDDEEIRLRVEQVLWSHAQELLAAGVDTLLENGLWMREERDEKRQWARRHGVEVELTVLDVPLEERWRRIERRNASPEAGHVRLTYADLEHYQQFFEPPDEDELALFERPPAGLPTA